MLPLPAIAIGIILVIVVVLLILIILLPDDGSVKYVSTVDATQTSTPNQNIIYTFPANTKIAFETDDALTTVLSSLNLEKATTPQNIYYSTQGVNALNSNIASPYTLIGGTLFDSRNYYITEYIQPDSKIAIGVVNLSNSSRKLKILSSSPLSEKIIGFPGSNLYQRIGKDYFYSLNSQYYLKVSLSSEGISFSTISQNSDDPSSNGVETFLTLIPFDSNPQILPPYITYTIGSSSFLTESDISNFNNIIISFPFNILLSPLITVTINSPLSTSLLSEVESSAVVVTSQTIVENVLSIFKNSYRTALLPLTPGDVTINGITIPFDSIPLVNTEVLSTVFNGSQIVETLSALSFPTNGNIGYYSFEDTIIISKINSGMRYLYIYPSVSGDVTIRNWNSFGSYGTNDLSALLDSPLSSTITVTSSSGVNAAHSPYTFVLSLSGSTIELNITSVIPNVNLITTSLTSVKSSSNSFILGENFTFTLDSVVYAINLVSLSSYGNLSITSSDGTLFYVI